MVEVGKYDPPTRLIGGSDQDTTGETVGKPDGSPFVPISNITAVVGEVSADRVSCRGNELSRHIWTFRHDDVSAAAVPTLVFPAPQNKNKHCLLLLLRL